MFELIRVREIPGDAGQSIRKNHQITDNKAYYSLEDALDDAEKILRADRLRQKKTPHRGPFLLALKIKCDDGKILDDATVRKLAGQPRD